ncbi:Gfo/Idh/MocA family protein [Thomasclavelia cocleata]|uniref:Gfo/Idh/MocA family protein n=1 Tax=Thomasclavelia cocleata TaxID=69824 RepID=UPI00242D03F6|nr:Gfo/Idh/MocA family oxidoreductase [Thomasclavelia cocleata]
MKLGIIGSGMIVQDLLSFVDTIEEINLIAILGRKKSQEKIEALTNKYQIKKIYYNYDDLLNDDEIDTVYVALPNHLHYEYTKKALLHNKHVICEKPFTSNIDELDELITLSKERKCLLFEAITNQYLPTYKNIKDRLSELGKISLISCNYSQYSSRYNAFKKGEILPVFDINMSGGALMDLNVYNLHFVIGLFGKPENVEYFANIERGIDTSGIIILEYPTFKAVCIGAKDCAAPISSTIQGDLGCIKIEGPTSVLSDVKIIKNDKINESIEVNSNNHRMYDEFKNISKYIDNRDFNTCDLMLKHSKIVMDVLTKARKSANIIFGCEKDAK